MIIIAKWNSQRVNQSLPFDVRQLQTQTGGSKCQCSPFSSSCFLFLRQCHVSHNELELTMKLSMTLNLWSSCVHISSARVISMCPHAFLAYRVLRTKHRALCMLGKHSTNWAIPTVPFFTYTFHFMWRNDWWVNMDGTQIPFKNWYIVKKKRENNRVL